MLASLIDAARSGTPVADEGSSLGQASVLVASIPDLADSVAEVVEARAGPATKASLRLEAHRQSVRLAYLNKRSKLARQRAAAARRGLVGRLAEARYLYDARQWIARAKDREGLKPNEKIGDVLSKTGSATAMKRRSVWNALISLEQSYSRAAA